MSFYTVKLHADPENPLEIEAASSEAAYHQALATLSPTEDGEPVLNRCATIRRGRKEQ